MSSPSAFAWICLLILSALSIRPERLVAVRVAASMLPVRADESTFGAVVPLFSFPLAQPTRAMQDKSIASLIDSQSGQKGLTWLSQDSSAFARGR